MNLIRSFLCLVVLTISLTTSSHLSAEKSDVEPDKEPLALLIGRARSTSSLIRPEKLYGTGENLPQPSKYRAGTIYKFQIDEVLRGNKTFRRGQTITVLIPGPGNVSHSVWLSLERRYLIQLASLVDAEKYKGTVVMGVADPSATKEPFDPHDVYTLIRDIDGAVPVTDDTKELIKRIKRKAQKK